MESNIMPSNKQDPMSEGQRPEVTQSARPRKRAGRPTSESQPAAKAAQLDAINTGPLMQDPKDQQQLDKASESKAMNIENDVDMSPATITWRDLVGTWQYQVLSRDKPPDGPKAVHVVVKGD